MESLISQIRKDKMNTICFDCGAENPIFVSINNGIFLCNQCASVHMSFPKGVSIIENNDLYSLSENELKFLAEGGNTSLNDFILDEFPKLENYSQKLLYKTRAMDYYRKRLHYYVNGGIEPRRPSQIVGCQLIPENFYSQNTYTRTIPSKYEPKTKTYKPDHHMNSRKFNIDQKNNAFDDEFFKDPFMKGTNFANESEMFKKFFGKDFPEEDDLFNFGEKKKINQSQYVPRTSNKYQEKPKKEYVSSYSNKNNNNNYYESKNNNNNIKEKEPQDNFSRGAYPGVYVPKMQRPFTATTRVVPSRKDKYMKKEEEENNTNNNNIYKNENVQRGGTVNPMKYMKSSYRDQYSQKDEKEKENPKQVNNYNNNRNINNEGKSYDPFKRRDSTELITIPGMENSNLLQNKRKPKTHEIPSEFSKQASGLGQISSAINENDNESISSKSNSISNNNSDNESEDKEKIEKDLDSSDELKKIPENNTHKDSGDNKEEPITFKNSIRNKYKQRKSQVDSEKKEEEEDRFKATPKPFNNNNVYESKYSKTSNTSNKKNEKNNIRKKPSKKINEFKTKKSKNIDNDESHPHINKSYARRLSKMNITSTNWNINQLGDINTYPEVIDVED